MKHLCHIIALFALLIVIPASHAESFSFKDTQGKQQTLKKYRGKWVLINFWATWCPPCIREMPELVNLHKEHHKKDLVVIGVAVDSGDTEKVMTFAKKLNVNFPLINWNWKKDLKMDQKITALFGDVSAIPSSFLFTPKGELVAQQRGGEIIKADIEAYIKTKKF